MSVYSHWPFDHYFQSLCLLVIHTVWNHTKIVSWSFPMSIFVWSTVWSSLIILRMSWRDTAAALNSWSSWLCHRNSPPPQSPDHHAGREKGFYQQKKKGRNRSPNPDPCGVICWTTPKTPVRYGVVGALLPKPRSGAVSFVGTPEKPRSGAVSFQQCDQQVDPDRDRDRDRWTHLCNFPIWISGNHKFPISGNLKSFWGSPMSCVGIRFPNTTSDL